MTTAAATEMPALAPAAAAPRRLRVLVADEALPFPPDSGKRLRTWHLLRRLARRHEVVLLCYGEESEAAKRALAALGAAGIECHMVAPPPEHSGWRLYGRLAGNCFSAWPYSVAKHHSRRFQAALEELLRRRAFDLVQVEWTPYASHLQDLPLPHVIATHNIEAQIWQRRGEISRSLAARLYFKEQARKMLRFERVAFGRAQAVTAVSAQERNEAVRLGARNASVVANGVDLEAMQPRHGEIVRERMLFLGALDWFANQDAVLHFAQVIFPLIRRLRPAAHLQVVGRRPPQALRHQLSRLDGVEMVGEVDAVQPVLAQAAVVVVPLRVGAGSRIKIVEALAMEKAVVSTRIGAEGLEVSDGEHLRLADEPGEFAAATAELLGDPDQAARLGRAGRRWVQAHHSWDDCARSLEQAWLQAAASRKEAHP